MSISSKAQTSHNHGLKRDSGLKCTFYVIIKFHSDLKAAEIITFLWRCFKLLYQIKAKGKESISQLLSPHAFMMKMFICLKRSTNNHFSRQEQEISSQGRFN